MNMKYLSVLSMLLISTPVFSQSVTFDMKSLPLHEQLCPQKLTKEDVVNLYEGKKVEVGGVVYKINHTMSREPNMERGKSMDKLSETIELKPKETVLFENNTKLMCFYNYHSRTSKNQPLVIEGEKAK